MGDDTLNRRTVLAGMGSGVAAGLAGCSGDGGGGDGDGGGDGGLATCDDEFGQPGPLESCAAITDQDYFRIDASDGDIVADFTLPIAFCPPTDPVMGQVVTTVDVEGEDYSITQSVIEAVTTVQEPVEDPIGFDETKGTVEFGSVEPTLWWDPADEDGYASARLYLPKDPSDPSEWVPLTVRYGDEESFIGSGSPIEECLDPLADATLRTARSIRPT